MTLKEFLQEKGFPEKPLDGRYHRFNRGGTNNGWFIGRQIPIPGGEVITIARFGDWKTSEKHEFQTQGDWSEEERQTIAAVLQQVQEEEDQARVARQQEVSDECYAKWPKYRTQGPSPYLQRKGLESELYGTRICTLPDGLQLTVVPAQDIEGKLWGLQYIRPDGSKNFKGGMRIQGCFHTLGKLTETTEVIYLAEGIATAASIFQALGAHHPVVSCFNAGNLLPVARALRHRIPHARLVICADNDAYTTHPTTGLAWNPGLEAAHEVGAQLGRVEIVYPKFGPDEPGKPTDFNDLHLLSGIESVKAQLQGGGEKPPAPEPGRADILEGRAQPEEPEGRGAGGAVALLEAEDDGSNFHPPEPDTPEPQSYPQGQGFAPGRAAWMDRQLHRLPVRISEDGKPKRASEKKIVDALLAYYGDDLVQQDGDLFLFLGTHWARLSDTDVNQIRRNIQFVAGGSLSHGQVESAFKQLLIYVPGPGADLNCMPGNMANFANGTLVVHRNPVDYSYRLEFRAHRKHDYLTFVIPVNYDITRSKRNEEFEAMISRVFDGDPDQGEKVRAVRQMYGACVCPIYPHLFLLHGPAASGKSSLIIPAQRLVHKDNWGSVEPHEFNGFNMESLAGKLVNFVTDINLTKPMDDANVKKIIDRRPVRIDRKFKRALYAPLPSVHVFGGNGIPRTLDAGSGAHTRRWTFIELSRYRAPIGKYMHDFGNWVFEQCPEGVLNFAIDGLEDLLKLRGHYTVPESGRVKMEEWSRENDPIGAFLHELQEGEVRDGNVQWVMDADALAPRARLWEVFQEWCKASNVQSVWISRNRFYRELRSRSFREYRNAGGRYFMGLGVITEDKAKF